MEFGRPEPYTPQTFSISLIYWHLKHKHNQVSDYAIDVLASLLGKQTFNWIILFWYSRYTAVHVRNVTKTALFPKFLSCCQHDMGLTMIDCGTAFYCKKSNWYSFTNDKSRSSIRKDKKRDKTRGTAANPKLSISISVSVVSVLTPTEEGEGRVRGAGEEPRHGGRDSRLGPR